MIRSTVRRIKEEGRVTATMCAEDTRKPNKPQGPIGPNPLPMLPAVRLRVVVYSGNHSIWSIRMFVAR